MGTAAATYEQLRALGVHIEPRFNQLAESHKAVSFAVEWNYALQILRDNEYLARTASGNQDSFMGAIYNCASIGLTINPARPLAYLVPRKQKVCLDISYRGLIHLAAEARAIMWAVPEIVYEKDTYESHGVGREPKHIRQPFAQERGKVVGAYCVAKTYSGEFIVAEMSAKELFDIRDRSESWKSGKSSPWKTDEAEMIKKTVIRRASKLWPLVDTSRFQKAIEIADNADPIDLAPHQPSNPEEMAQGLASIRTLLTSMNKKEDEYVTFLTRQLKRNIKTLGDMTPLEMEKAEAFLKSLVKEPAAPPPAGGAA